MSDANASAARPESPFVPAQDLSELQARLGAILKENNVPGMGVALADRERVIWAAGIGLADVAAGKRATAETLFRIASVSKTFVALAVLKLVEQGRLSLETPVRSLVPDVVFTNAWEPTDPVRVVHLLEHTTGWDDIHPIEMAYNDPTPLTLAAALAVSPQTRTSRWRPGTRFAYSNAGPAVAAAIVERVSGKRFEDYVRESFFDPIGMPTADYFASERTRALLTTLYHRDAWTPYPYWHDLFRPCGALNASPRELGAYLRFFLRQGRADSARILTEASMRRMETPVSSYGANGGLDVGCGLDNCAAVDRRGFLWHGHDGAKDGARSAFFYRPEQGVGYFFALNAGNWKAFDEVYKELTAYLTKEIADPILPPAQDVAPEVLDNHDGWYAPASPRVQALAWQERLRGLTHLTVRKNGVTIAPLSGPSRRFVAVDRTRFRLDDSSVPTLVLMDTPEGRLYVWFASTWVKIGSLQAWTQIILTGLVALAMLSVPLFALVWGARWSFRRMRGVPLLYVRVLPLVTWLSLLGGVLLVPDLLLPQEDALNRFGHLTVWSVALAITSWVFSLCSVISVVAALHAWKRRRTMNPFAYYHSLGVAVLFTIATAYLACYGVIGYRSWA